MDENVNSPSQKSKDLLVCFTSINSKINKELSQSQIDCSFLRLMSFELLGIAEELEESVQE